VGPPPRQVSHRNFNADQLTKIFRLLGTPRPAPPRATPASAVRAVAAAQAPRLPTASRPARRDRAVLGRAACTVHFGRWPLYPKRHACPPAGRAARGARAGRRDARGRGAGRLREHVLAALRHPRVVLLPRADGGRAAAPEAAAAAWAAALEALLEVDQTRRAAAAEVLALPLFAPAAAAGAATEGAAGGAKTAGDSALRPHTGGAPRPDSGARGARFGV